MGFDSPANWDNWVKPEKGKEGPFKFGYSNPGCTDCFGCSNFLSSNEDRSFELLYMSLEFSKDREFQTEDTFTSQETILKYISKNWIDKNDLNTTKYYFLFNFGFHDMEASIGVDDFGDNIDWFLSIMTDHKQLNKIDKEIIWLTISDVKMIRNTLRRQS
eukprot:UN31257